MSADQYMLTVIIEYACSGEGLICFQLTADEFLKKLKPVDGEPLHFFVDHPDSKEVKIIPYDEVKDKLLYKFTCFSNLRGDT
ncbi:MAG: hypothetical protein LBJ00_06140 [Planctomycetaceae bacterium]|nr:hypothetical protein [Planctomycetaceae bacterium]